MLAASESRTIPSAEDSEWLASGLTRYDSRRPEIKRVFFFTRYAYSILISPRTLWKKARDRIPFRARGFDEHHGSRHLWDTSQRVRHRRMWSLPNTRSSIWEWIFTLRERIDSEGRYWVLFIFCNNWSLASNNDLFGLTEAIRSTLVMTSDDDHRWWKWVDPVGNARRTGDLGELSWWHVTRVKYYRHVRFNDGSGIFIMLL